MGTNWALGPLGATFLDPMGPKAPLAIVGGHFLAIGADVGPYGGPGPHPEASGDLPEDSGRLWDASGKLFLARTEMFLVWERHKALCPGHRRAMGPRGAQGAQGGPWAPWAS